MRLLATGLLAAATALPSHVYAPYFETWKRDSIPKIAQQSNARYFTLAFAETLGKRSCTLAWNGRKTDKVAAGRYLPEIASLRALGGDVIFSFGGWSADQGGTDLGDSCRSVKAIAAAYQSVVKRYGITRIDLDIEGRSLRRSAGIDRRNKAIKRVEDWATSHRIPLQVSYTLPTTPYGLAPRTLRVLQNAVANGVRVDVVNIMAFDYFDDLTIDMGDAAITAAQGLLGQLEELYPTKTEAALWAMEGITLLPGVDDYPKQTEVTDLADAQVVYAFARSVGIGTLSIWSAQRDAGAWDFSRMFAPYTRP
jgi:hypothetical protein